MIFFTRQSFTLCSEVDGPAPQYWGLPEYASIYSRENFPNSHPTGTPTHLFSNRADEKTTRPPFSSPTSLVNAALRARHANRSVFSGITMSPDDSLLGGPWKKLNVGS